MSNERVTRSKSKTDKGDTGETEVETEFKNFKPNHRSTNIPPSPFAPRLSLSRSPPATPKTPTDLFNFPFVFAEPPGVLPTNPPNPTKVLVSAVNTKTTKDSSGKTTPVDENTGTTKTDIVQINTALEHTNTQDIVLNQTLNKNTQTQKTEVAQKTTQTNTIVTVKVPEKELNNHIHIFTDMAHNTTLENALAETKTPATPKFIQPPTFNPSIDLPVTFISKYERIAICNGWTDSYKIAYLGSFLEGPATLWYNDYSNEPANKNKTWGQIKKDFIKEFSGEQPLRKLKFKLASRKQQANEDIKPYYYDLLALANEVDEKMSFDSFREYFENGLHPSFYETYYLMSTADMNYARLKALVLKLSEIRERALVRQMTAQTSLLAIEDSYSENTRQDRTQPQYNRYNAANNGNSTGNYREQYQNRGRRPRGNYSSRGQRTFYRGANGYRGGQHRNYRGRNTHRGNNGGNRGSWVPNTRCNDGRPRCTNCNRCGHYSCGEERQERRVSFSRSPSPNGRGRLNH